MAQLDSIVPLFLFVPSIPHEIRYCATNGDLASALFVEAVAKFKVIATCTFFVNPCLQLAFPNHTAVALAAVL